MNLQRVLAARAYARFGLDAEALAATAQSACEDAREAAPAAHGA